MAWKQIAAIPTQYDIWPGYWVRFETAGTSNDINMATDATGGTLISKAEVDDEGLFVTTSSARFIPHLNQTYKVSLYPSEADADAKTNAEFSIDNLEPIGQTDGTDNIIFGENYDTLAEAVTAADGKKLLISTAIASDSTTIPSTVQLEVILGGSLDANTGEVITNNTYPEAGSYRIFNGAGLIKGDFGGGDLDVAWWGATGSATRTVTTAAIKAALTTMAEAMAASTDFSSYTMCFNALNYEVNGAIPLSTGMHLKMPAWRGGRFDQSAAEPMFYSATFSGGVFTDNLDQPAVTNEANHITLTNLRIDHTGATITGNSPDSSTAWDGVIHFVNTSKLRVSSVRVDMHAHNQNAFYLKNTFFVYIFEYSTSCGSSFHGGYGLKAEGLCNNVLLEWCEIKGGFERGYSFDGTVNSMDSITLLECDAEGIDYTSTSGNQGVGTAVWCGGTQ